MKTDVIGSIGDPRPSRRINHAALTYPIEHCQVRPIERDHLLAKLIRGDHFKLVMALPAWAYRAKHIPGSIQLDTPEAALAALARDDEIVVYSSCAACPSSRVACRLLADHGFHDVRHYAGGLLEWEEAGYPLEGDWVEHPVAAPEGGSSSRTDVDDPAALAQTDALMDQLWAAESATGGSSIRSRAEETANDDTPVSR